LNAQVTGAESEKNEIAPAIGTQIEIKVGTETGTEIVVITAMMIPVIGIDGWTILETEIDVVVGTILVIGIATGIGIETGTDEAPMREMTDRTIE
jgi:hypothetical protein